MVCAFTGHRQEKFSFGTDEQHPDCRKIKRQIHCEIRRMVAEGVNIFITGMCRGVDLWVAEIVLQLRDSQPSGVIQLWAAIPYDRQAVSWRHEDRDRYEEILSKADRVEYISHAYTRACLHQRNRWMCDQATHLLAVYDGQPGGTKNTIDYARKKGLNITIIEP